MATKKKKTATGKRKTSKQVKKNSYIQDTVLALLLILSAVLTFISFVSHMIDPVGTWIKAILLGLFGAGGYIFPFLAVYIAAVLIFKSGRPAFKFGVGMLFTTLFAAFFNVFAYNIPESVTEAGAFPKNFAALTADLFETGKNCTSGGVIGGWIELLFRSFASKVGSGIIIGAGMLIALVITTGVTFATLKKIFTLPSQDEIEVDKQSGKARPVSVSRDIKAIKKDLHKLARQTEKADRTGKFANDEDLILSTVKQDKNGEKQSSKAADSVLPNSVQTDSENGDIDSILNEISSSYRQNARKAEKIRKKKKIRQQVSDESGDLLLPFTAKKAVNSTIAPKSAEFIFPAVKTPGVKTVPAAAATPATSPDTVNATSFGIPVSADGKMQPELRNKTDKPQAETPVQQNLTQKEPEPRTEQENTDQIISSDILDRAVTHQKTAEQLNYVQTEIKPEYTLPPLSLLEYKPDANTDKQKEELIGTAAKLKDALLTFGVETTVLDAKRGPTVTRYELAPNAGVRINRITNLSDDIALHLAASAVRIEAPIPGKSAIGIEIPNKNPGMVYLKEIIASDEFKNAKSRISVALGKDISGAPVVIDLAKMPHLLIAGSTGSGKSVCINSILMSILYKASPDEVKLLLVDPKVVELKVYNSIPHLLIPVVTQANRAAGALQWAVQEMMQRYKLFAEKNVRDFAGYNKSLRPDEEKMPQVVIVTDELADLIMVAKSEVEDAICRLAQMARAAGMHLVVATQRPSADVITGLIKANIPSRISFAVSSQIDSRVILDTTGAEKLIGRGDMLYSPLGAIKPLRVQGCFVSDKEVEAVIDQVKLNGEAKYDESVLEKIKRIEAQSAGGGASSDGDGENSKEDPRLMEAIECVVDKGIASTSMLQRFLGLGYARAAKVIDQMEARGIVGPFQGSKPREVLMTKSQFEEWRARNEE